MKLLNHMNAYYHIRHERCVTRARSIAPHFMPTACRAGTTSQRPGGETAGGARRDVAGRLGSVAKTGAQRPSTSVALRYGGLLLITLRLRDHICHPMRIAFAERLAAFQTTTGNAAQYPRHMLAL
jgi:hypothetical protein